MPNTPAKKTTTKTKETTTVTASTPGTPAKPKRLLVADVKKDLDALTQRFEGSLTAKDKLSKDAARKVDELYSALRAFELTEDQDTNEFLAAGRLKRLESLATAVSALSVNLVEVEERLNKKIDDNYTELKGDVERVDGRIDRSNGRIFSLESYRDKVEWWPLVVAAIVTILVAIFLIPHVFMTDPIPLPDGSSLPAQLDTDKNSWWWKGMVLAGVFLGVAGLGTIASRIVSRWSRSHEQNQREKEARRPVPAAPSHKKVTSAQEDETPTKPYETTRTPVGANSGSH